MNVKLEDLSPSRNIGSLKLFVVLFSPMVCTYNNVIYLDVINYLTSQIHVYVILLWVLRCLIFCCLPVVMKPAVSGENLKELFLIIINIKNKKGDDICCVLLLFIVHIYLYINLYKAQSASEKG